MALIGAFAFLLDTNIVLALLEHLENFGILFLFTGTATVLLWFVYRVFLRKVFRVWRIARIRSRRLLEEAASRDRE